jgi:NADH dehydrogenase FAD-containing subunit
VIIYHFARTISIRIPSLLVPVRELLRRAKKKANFLEAYCTDIDPEKNIVHCVSKDHDYLIGLSKFDKVWTEPKKFPYRMINLY